MGRRSQLVTCIRVELSMRCQADKLQVINQRPVRWLAAVNKNLRMSFGRINICPINPNSQKTKASHQMLKKRPRNSDLLKPGKTQ